MTGEMGTVAEADVVPGTSSERWPSKVHLFVTFGPLGTHPVVVV